VRRTDACEPCSNDRCGQVRKPGVSRDRPEPCMGLFVSREPFVFPKTCLTCPKLRIPNQTPCSMPRERVALRCRNAPAWPMRRVLSCLAGAWPRTASPVLHGRSGITAVSDQHPAIATHRPVQSLGAVPVGQRQLAEPEINRWKRWRSGNPNVLDATADSLAVHQMTSVG
jgi:hypothetical protein